MLSTCGAPAFVSIVLLLLVFRGVSRPVWRIIAYHALQCYSADLPATPRIGCCVDTFPILVNWDHPSTVVCVDSQDDLEASENNIEAATYNTVPLEEKTSRRLLAHNVDTLHASLSWGDVSRDIVQARLDSIREWFNERSGDAGAVLLPPEFRILGQPLYAAYDRAGVLTLTAKNWFSFRFPYGKGKTLCTISVYSRPFWDRSLLDVVNEVQNFCDWFVSVRNVAVLFSRGDLCADVEGFNWFHWSDQEFRRHLVCRARRRAAHSPEDGDYITPQTECYGNGFVVGKGDVQCRIYDKLKELKDHAKDNYYLPHWERNGYEAGSVMRVEFQLRRAFFASWVVPETGEKLHTIQDFAAQVATIWRYLTHDWMRLVEPSDTDTNKRRAPTRLDWAFVSRAFVVSEEPPQGVRMKRFHDRRVHALKQQFVGVFLTAAVQNDQGYCNDPRYYEGLAADWLHEIAEEKRMTIPELARLRHLELEGGVRNSA